MSEAHKAAWTPERRARMSAWMRTRNPAKGTRRPPAIPTAHYAYRQVKEAILAGKLLPAATYKCADCGEQAEQYEHRDYSKPLEVEPVCRSCNWHRGTAKNSDREYHNGIGYQGYRYAKLGNEQSRPLPATKGNPEKSVRDFIDEHWITYERDIGEMKATQEIMRGYCKPGYINWTRTFERALNDWFGVAP